MSTGSKDLAGVRSLYDEQQDYVPLDTNIAEGLVCCFSNTSGDNRAIVLPSHANALLGGRAFAGISAAVGSPVLAQDTSWATQRSGIAKCALKDSTACTRGQTAAYDPADSGKVVPYTSATQVPIGEFIQTLSSGTSQMVGVALWKSGKSIPMIGKAAGVSSTVTNTAAETAFDKTVSIPANLLNSGSVVRIRGAALCLNNGASTATLKVYWGSTAIATSPGVAPTPSANDGYYFDLMIDVRSATAAWVSGSQCNIAAPGTAAFKLVEPAVLTIDTTAAVTISVKVTYSGANAADQFALESLVVTQDGSSAY